MTAISIAAAAVTIQAVRCMVRSRSWPSIQASVAA
jgi:hypothetical protein